MEIKMWSSYNDKPVATHILHGPHNSSDNWACDCCGMRRDTINNPVVKPEDSYIGVRIYVDGHVRYAGEQNKVVNLTTKNGPIGVVLTQEVLLRHTKTLADPGVMEDDDDDRWEDFDGDNE